MPSTNVEPVRYHAPWERGDMSSRGWAHPEIECVIADGPDRLVVRAECDVGGIDATFGRLRRLARRRSRRSLANSSADLRQGDARRQSRGFRPQIRPGSSGTLLRSPSSERAPDRRTPIGASQSGADVRSRSPAVARHDAAPANEREPLGDRDDAPRPTRSPRRATPRCVVTRNGLRCLHRCSALW